ncbi:MAG: hypothetical protein MR286_04640 [Clostridiales bacterium]|nr:hypothetical protein [Clostridiales bacterium]
MMSDESLTRVYETVRFLDRPVSVREVSDAVKLSNLTTISALTQLVRQGKIEMVQDGSGNYYQVSVAGKTKEESDLEIRFAQLDKALNDRITKLDERIVQVEKETNHIYANMISIMGVFVAIFALIVINANAIVGTISEDAKICDALLKLVVLNVPVMFCIIALLVGVRFIILRDFKRGEHK